MGHLTICQEHNSFQLWTYARDIGKLEPEDKPKTAFVTKRGLYKFDRPGTSIRNATHCFCRVLVFASSELFNLIYLLTVKIG